MSYRHNSQIARQHRRWMRPNIGRLLTVNVSMQLLMVLTASRGWCVEPPTAVVEAEAERVRIIKDISRPTLAIFGADSAGGGSGVVISPDGYALTNYHVVQPCGNHLRCGMNDGVMYDAVVVSIDPTGDVALIKLVGRDDFPAATLGDSDQLEAGQTCYVVGNPFVLATDFQPTVTYGIISGVHRYQYPSGTLLEYADCIQTDASINPGNSGGPLFNADGELVGVNGRASFEKRGRVNVGVGYAISINQIKKFMGHLRSGRIVDHATTGFTVSSDENGQLIVSNILESSDAFRRGLRYDDEIVSLGGRSIRTVNTYKNVLGTYPKGWRIPVVYRRGGEETQMLVRLAGVHSEGELAEKLTKQESPKGHIPKDREKHGEDEGELEIPKLPIPPRGEKSSGDDAMPASVERLFEERRGYANFYFNRQNVERVWSQFTAEGNIPSKPGAWTLKGKAGEEPFEISLNDEKVIATLPEIMTLVDMTRDLSDQLEPPGSGGMLVALQMWRRMLTEGPERFGEVYYFGTAPVDSSGRLYDVLVGLYDEFETRFYFDQHKSELRRIELFPPGDVDPCEIHLGEYRRRDSIRKPTKLQIRVGDATYGNYELKQLTLPGEDAT